MASMRICLRNRGFTDRPEEAILWYYQEMGRGVRAYDEGVIPSDDQFPREQLERARELANKLGGRGIPYKAIDEICAKQAMISRELKELSSAITILDESERIPWKSVTELFDAFRVRYVTTARYTKMLHKKRPNLIPILDSRVVNDYLLPTMARGTTAGLSDAEKATLLVKEIRKDVLQNKDSLLGLYKWPGKPFPITILRIFDILVWCRFGPFRNRFAALYAAIS
jgi:hypothetical protein